MAAPDQRAEVFERIREALQRPAPHRHAAHSSGAHPAPDDGLPASDEFRDWLPSVGITLDEQIELFARNADALKAEFFQATTADDVVRQLAELARENNWKRVATHAHPLAAGVAEKLSLSLPPLFTAPGYPVAELEQCDAAITGCDALVAQTGSVMVSAPGAGGRALSVLPPHHIVLARRGQMVPDLTAAFRRARELYAPDWPSFLSFITGPSRTGDIERILVLGAHGPKRLTIFLLP